MEVSSIILAGGRNARFGRDKAMETLNGKRLIECVVERLRPLSRQVLVITSRDPNGLGLPDGVRIVPDVYPGKGPLGGIYTGLLASPSPLNIAVACDMPFLNTALLRHMVGLAPGFDAVVPRPDDRQVEPLHAIYSRDCLEPIKTRIAAGQLQINLFLRSAHVRYLDREECAQFDPGLRSFFNINSPADMELAIRLCQTPPPPPPFTGPPV